MQPEGVRVADGSEVAGRCLYCGEGTLRSLGGSLKAAARTKIAVWQKEENWTQFCWALKMEEGSQEPRNVRGF